MRMTDAEGDLMTYRLDDEGTPRTATCHIVDSSLAGELTVRFLLADE
jgi:hypothetical protein